VKLIWEIWDKTSGMEKFLELVDRVNGAQDPNSNEAIFFLLTSVHLLMLQITLNDLKTVGDAFSNLERLNMSSSQIVSLLKPPCTLLSK